MRTYAFLTAAVMANTVFAGLPLKRGSGLISRDTSTCDAEGLTLCPGSSDPSHCYSPEKGESCCGPLLCLSNEPLCGKTSDGNFVCCEVNDTQPGCVGASSSTVSTVVPTTSTVSPLAATTAPVVSTTTTPDSYGAVTTSTTTPVTPNTTTPDSYGAVTPSTSSAVEPISTSTAPGYTSTIPPPPPPMPVFNGTSCDSKPVDCKVLYDTLELLADLLAKRGHGHGYHCRDGYHA